MTVPERVSLNDVLPNTYEPDAGPALPIGETDTGLATVDTSISGASVIAGGVASGKTTTLQTLAASAVARGQDVVVIDTETGGQSFGSLAPYLCDLATDADAAEDALQRVRAEIDVRYGLMKRAGVYRVTDLTKTVINALNLRPALVLIDDYDHLAGGDTETAAEVRKAVDYVSCLGRDAGVHVVVATSRYDGKLFSPCFLVDVPGNLVLSGADLALFDELLGHVPHEDVTVPAAPGTGVIAGLDTAKPVRVAYTPTQMVLMLLDAVGVPKRTKVSR